LFKMKEDRRIRLDILRAAKGLVTAPKPISIQEKYSRTVELCMLLFSRR
jgi:hypothetical protein